MSNKTQARSSNGKYRKSRWPLFVMAACVGVIVSVMVFAPRNEVIAANETQMIKIEVDHTPEKIEALKDQIIEEIAQCESHNVDQSVGLVTLDNNKSKTLKRKDIPSYGVMQYKVSTVQHHYKTLYGTDLTDYEAVLLALDNKKAKALAKDAIFRIKGALWSWTCATSEQGVKVGIIRELSK